MKTSDVMIVSLLTFKMLPLLESACWCISPEDWCGQPPPCVELCRVSLWGCLAHSFWTVSWLGFSRCFLGLIVLQSLGHCNLVLFQQYDLESPPDVLLIVQKGGKFLVVYLRLRQARPLERNKRWTQFYERQTTQSLHIMIGNISLSVCRLHPPVSLKQL